EGVKILAVKRRHKRAMQALDRVVRDRVAPMLGVTDRVDLGGVGRIRREHRLQIERGHPDFLGHRLEKIEELLVAGNETPLECHAGSLHWRYNDGHVPEKT